MLTSLLQDPAVAAATHDAAAVGAESARLAAGLGWVDCTALGVLGAFCIIGLFKGLIWQVSRVATLAAAYVAAVHFGAGFGAFLARTPLLGGTAPAPAVPGVPAVPLETPETTLYVAYVLLFLGVLIATSLVAMLCQKLANKAGLGFFDRLGGGVLGVATGAAVVLFGLFLVNMFFRGTPLAVATEASHSLRLSRQAIGWLGQRVPDPLRGVLALAPLNAPAGTRTGVPVDAAGQPDDVRAEPATAPAPHGTRKPGG